MQQVLERILDRIGNQIRPRLQIAAEPAQRQLVHERQRRICKHAERNQQRDDESQRQTHGFLYIPMCRNEFRA